MKKLFVSVVSIILSVNLMAQVSPFLEKGQSGLGFNVGADKGLGFNGVFATVGTSIKGNLDLEFDYYADKFDKAEIGLLDNNSKSIYWSTCVTWWVVKTQLSPFMDINVGLRPGFEQSSNSNYRYNDPETSKIVEYNGYKGGIIGVWSNVSFNLTKNWVLQPMYGIEYQLGTQKETISNVESKSTYNGVWSSLGITLAKKLEGSNTFYFSLRQFFDTYGTGDTYSLAIGYVLPFKKNKKSQL